MSHLGKTWSISLLGLNGYPIEVQAHLAAGLPGFALVGLPDASLRESRDRVRAALASCHVEWPDRRCTINLSPAELPKTGSGFDLAIAVALAVAGRKRPSQKAFKTVYLGELGLDGALHPVRGILPAVAEAARAGFERVVVPRGCLREAELIDGIEVKGAAHLSEVLVDLGMKCDLVEVPATDPAIPKTPENSIVPDLADVRGQQQARIALEIAAAGRHHLFMEGVPGAGKTMLASCLPTLLPDLDPVSAVEVTSIHSLAGTFDASAGLIHRPPFIAPHHGATAPALLGGGSAVPRPGAVSLAHRGVLFLDEAPEFAPTVLDGLRQPLEEGALTIHRARAAVHLPAKFQLVMAANPCPCGNNVGKDAIRCTCSSLQKRRYLSRLSGPLLDRVDIRVRLTKPTAGSLALDENIEDSATVAARVAAARQRARQRWETYGWDANSQIPGPFLRSEVGGIPGSIRKFLDKAVEDGRLSMRGVDRVCRVAWTLADLAGKDQPEDNDVFLAMTMRDASAE